MPIFSIRIGKYIIGQSIHHPAEKIHIGRADGEGGDFDAIKFEELIDRFYKENF